MTGALGRGEAVDDPDRFVAEFATEYYGLDGARFVRLHELLSLDLEALLEGAMKSALPRHWGVRLRVALCRGILSSPYVLKSGPYPHPPMMRVWEPTPFAVWLYLRPVLDEPMLARLESMAEEARALADELDGAARRRADQLRALTGSARAFAIMVEHLRLITSAKAAYHRAAMSQGVDSAAFREGMGETGGLFERMRPGLRDLKAIIEDMGETSGFDRHESHWLDVLMQSLDEHIVALRLRAENETSDSLLEFGEFLKRPANVDQRVTWR
jgi:hypothetical protein